MSRFDLPNRFHDDTPVEDFRRIEGGVPHCFIVGLDIGKLRDHTALVVNEVLACENVFYQRTKFQPEAVAVRRERIFRHSLVNLHRYELGLSYPEIYSSVKGIMDQLPKRAGAKNSLICDQTGVGGPVVDGLRHIGLRPIGVTITGGTTVTHVDARTINVPKSVLASSLEAVLTQDRLDVADDASASQQFKHELGAFSVKIRASGTEAFEAERERDHDDLVMAAALAVWYAENLPTPTQFTNIPRVRI
ncbi:hypothetical protein [Lichenicoccus sp.]|uniref:hypothetical protein n=1 Tax=Lichenicoccus sp. TaxID=2781899 RepID=UPI003D0BB383